MAQNTILWKVSDTLHHKTSYLVGTFHQFGNSFVDSIPQIKEALMSSKLAVFESIEDVESTRNMINQRVSSTDIEKWLKKKDLVALKEVSQHWEVDLYKLKPLEISWKLQQEFQKVKCQTVHPSDDFDHFDSYLIYLAQLHGKEIVGLETDSLQLDLIAQEYKYPDWKSERKRIRTWVQLLQSEQTDFDYCQLAKKYRKFDLDYELEKECEASVLLMQRNNVWMKSLPRLLRSQDTFVAVGLYHLMKQCGIIEQLRSQGFLVEPLEIVRIGEN
ncbi:TraB/GumN family protein [Cytophagales bacterium LB-30]|uniref:TraB/GumN family protein n=1 Tax=Shiella aurantiaca TaxID=3058365 RepID=A0ABT8F844_9BACT|nr:TraB/GumN family protein [Shiella aurantiaca]MDN4166458.1 TraB/GumN family protein [Shiella aurantiaca]